MAFCTTFSLYEYLVMPFGLDNAPTKFKCTMEKLFQPHQNYTRVFFENIIIYSKSLEEHKQYLEVIFKSLRENKFFVNQKKSKIFLK